MMSAYGDHSESVVPEGLFGAHAPVHADEDMHAEQVTTCTTGHKKRGSREFNTCTNGCNRPCVNPRSAGLLCCTRNPLNVNEEECKAENSAWCNADGIPHIALEEQDEQW